MKHRPTNYYLSRKSKLFRGFDKTAGLVRDSVVARYGETFADTLYSETRHEFEALLPQLPYLDHVVLRTFLIISAQELAVYKVMKRHAKTVGEAWELCDEALRMRLNKIPRFVRWLAEHYFFSGLARRRAHKLAPDTQQRPIGDFSFTFVDGDDKTFDFGVDYTGCSIKKFMWDQGAEEFAPYVCLSDIPLSETFGWGLIRSETLADGCQRCNFRFNKGGETQISSPAPEVQATIEKMIRKKEADYSQGQSSLS